MSTIGTTVGLLGGCFLTFSIIRKQFWQVYEYEAETGEVSSTWFGWIPQSWGLPSEVVQEEAGLDHAMFCEFCDLSIRILIMLAVPLVLILGPVHYALGGGAAGDNMLNYLSMANVKAGSNVLWVHPVAVWYVVLVVMRSIHGARQRFMVRRGLWLKKMPEPRCNTVLVEDVPETWRTDDKVKEYFDHLIFNRKCVKRAVVMKRTSDLTYLIDRQRKIEDLITEAKTKKVDTSELNLRLKEAKEEVKQKRELITSSDMFNTATAFVEFFDRRDKVLAVKMFSEDDLEEVIVTPAPDVSDVHWKNLSEDSLLQGGKDLTGKALIIAIFFAFMPLTVFIQSIAHIYDISESSPLYAVQANAPSLIVMWNGLVGALALSFLMGLIPTVLSLIFEAFFKMLNKSATQLYLQQWYFTFLIIFVVLVSAVGNSLFHTIVEILENPSSLVFLLARTLPYSTHFYLSYMVVQWGPEGLALLRTANLVKYTAFLPIFGEERAKELAEPEDPVSFGIGARSARFSLLLVIPLVFCTLAPTITLFSIVNFCLGRLVYKYLFMYAECRKGDSGGSHWECQLASVQASLIIFIVLMTGVLAERMSWQCGGLAASSAIYWKYMIDRGNREFKSDTLGFHEIKSIEAEHGFTKGLYDTFHKTFGAIHKFDYRQVELEDDSRHRKLLHRLKDHTAG